MWFLLLSPPACLPGLQLSLVARKNWKAWVQVCAHESSPAHGAVVLWLLSSSPAPAKGSQSSLPSQQLSGSSKAKNSSQQVFCGTCNPNKTLTTRAGGQQRSPLALYVYPWWSQLGPLKILPAASVTGFRINSRWCWEKHQGQPESHGWPLSDLHSTTCNTQETYWRLWLAQFIHRAWITPLYLFFLFLVS